MNIQQVISTQLASVVAHANNERVLYVYIGKILNRQCFTVNNKLFMDILYSTLLQNGWYMRSRHVQKEFRWSRERSLIRKMNDITSTYVGLEIPVEFQDHGLIREEERIVRYSGTYFDILCVSYIPNMISIKEHPEFLEEFQQNVSNLFCQCIEEVNVFAHKNNKLSVLLNIERGDMTDDRAFISKIEIRSTAAENEQEVEKLFDLIELAMCKYKKTDRGISSEYKVV